MTIPNAATANAGWNPNWLFTNSIVIGAAQGADVDAHVEDVIGAILQVAAFGIEIADHCRDVRLEEPVSDHEAG